MPKVPARPKKPTLLRHIVLESQIIGGLMRDEKGYFYRPKRSKITVGPHSEKWDGAHFETEKECERSIWGTE
jgi:hypothetical protein